MIGEKEVGCTICSKTIGQIFIEHIQEHLNKGEQKREEPAKPIEAKAKKKKKLVLVKKKIKQESDFLPPPKESIEEENGIEEEDDEKQAGKRIVAMADNNIARLNKLQLIVLEKLVATLSPLAQKAFKAMKEGKTHFTDISKASGIDRGNLNNVLNLLIKEGIAKKQSFGVYVLANKEDNGEKFVKERE